MVYAWHKLAEDPGINPNWVLRLTLPENDENSYTPAGINDCQNDKVALLVHFTHHY